MAAPTFVASYAPATPWGSNTSPLTASVTVAAGDCLVVTAITSNSGNTLATPTGGSGITWTLRQSAVTNASTCFMYVWTAENVSAQTFTLSITRTAGANVWGFRVQRWSGVASIGASNIGQSTGAATIALTTTAANSAIVLADGDWNAVAPGTPTYSTATAGAFTAIDALASGTFYSVYTGYYADAGAAGAKTVGVTAPTGQKWTVGAVELVGGASGPTAAGEFAHWTLTPPGRLSPQSILDQWPPMMTGDDVTMPPPTGQTVALPTAVETDAGQAIGRSKARALPIATETDAGQLLGRLKARVLAIATELDAAQLLGRAKARVLPPATETDAAQALARSKRLTLPIATATNVAQLLGRIKSRVLPIAPETDTARTITRAGGLGGPLPTAIETDAAQALARQKSRALPLAGETDTGQGLARRKSRALPLATETDAGQLLGRLKARVLALATETDIAQAFTRSKRRDLTSATESDAAQLLGRSKRRTLPTSTESDAATLLGRVKARVLPWATELDTARLLARLKSRVLPWATETDQARTLTNPSAAPVVSGVILSAELVETIRLVSLSTPTAVGSLDAPSIEVTRLSIPFAIGDASMKLNDETRTRITVTVQLSADPTGSTPELKIDSTWYPATWQGSPTQSNGIWTQSARTTGYFAGPNVTPAGAVVLALGQHPAELRVTWPSADAVVSYAGVVEVAAL